MTSSARNRHGSTWLEGGESLVFAAWLTTVIVAIAGAFLNGWLGLALAFVGGIFIGVLSLHARTPAPWANQLLETESSLRAAAQALVQRGLPWRSAHRVDNSIREARTREAAGTHLRAGSAPVAQAPHARLQPYGPVPAKASPGRGWFNTVCAVLDRNELLLIALVSPLFIFPQTSLVWVAILIPALWLNRLYVRGYVSTPSPLNIPLLLLLLMLAPSFLIAADSEVALPKLMGLLLGIGLYAAILNYPSEHLADIGMLAIVWLAIVIAAVGYVGTDWPVSGKLPLYGDIYRALPKLLHNIRGSTPGGINPNETGGTLSWLVPFLAASWLLRPWGRTLQAWLASGLLITALLLCTVLLFLSQSRGAVFAVLSGTLILLALASRRLTWLFASALLVLVLILFVRVGIAGVDEIAGPSGVPAGGVFTSAGDSVFGRTAIWQAAAELAHRSPIGGVGLAMFSVVLPQVAPAITQQTAHAHNELLQSAMDFGLPGLAAYTGILVCAFGLLFLVVRASPRGTRVYVLALALACGLAAHQIFAFTDAVALGAKPGFIFWVFLGLVAYLARGRPSNESLTTVVSAT